MLGQQGCAQLWLSAGSGGGFPDADFMLQLVLVCKVKKTFHRNTAKMMPSVLALIIGFRRWEKGNCMESSQGGRARMGARNR